MLTSSQLQNFVRVFAESTNGRAYAQCCVRLSSVTCVLWLVLPQNCLKKQIENGLRRESNGYVTDDVTSRDPERSRSMTPICLEPTISKTAGDRASGSKYDQ